MRPFGQTLKCVEERITITAYYWMNLVWVVFSLFVTNRLDLSVTVFLSLFTLLHSLAYTHTQLSRIQLHQIVWHYPDFLSHMWILEIVRADTLHTHRMLNTRAHKHTHTDYGKPVRQSVAMSNTTQFEICTHKTSETSHFDLSDHFFSSSWVLNEIPLSLSLSFYVSVFFPHSQLE